jgi:integrase
MSYADRTKRPPRIPTDAEMARVFKVSGQHRDGFRDHVIISLAVGTGLRESEIVALNIEDVSPDAVKVYRTIRLKKWKLGTKAKKNRDGTRDDQQVHLPDGTYYKLEKYLKSYLGEGEPASKYRLDTQLFWSREGNRLSTRRVREMWREWQKAAKFDHLYPFHALRHKAITNAYAATGNIRIAQRVARHARLDTTTRYEHASDEQVATAIKGLAS